VAIVALSIREYVQAHLPETYRVITDSGSYDGEDKPDLIAAEIDVCMDVMFVDGTTEMELGAFTRAYVADVVIWRLVSAYIDYVMWQTRRQDSMSRPPGMEPGGGESSQNYDRVATLKDLANMIGRRLEKDRFDFEALNESILRRNAGAELIGARISSDPGSAGYTSLVTPDAAQSFPAIGAPGLVPDDPFGGRGVGGFGVPVIIVPEQFQQRP
jgi:hypothetical protein